MAAKQPYQIYYWAPPILQGGPGRSEFVKLVLEEAGEPYEMVHDNIMELFKGGQWKDFPAFAVPCIKQGDFNLSQTAVICRYLGKKLGLYPDKEVDQWHAEQLNATVHDYIGEGRLAFHGKSWAESYFEQQEETRPYIAYFTEKRMPIFLQHFEKALAANREGTSFLVGDKVTYLDLAMLHALRVTENQFPEAWAEQVKTLPLLAAYKQRMANRPRMKAYFSSPRCLPFSGNSMM